MYNAYDKSLHAPLRYRAMESPAQELDEAETDSAIASILGEEAPAKSPLTSVETQNRPDFPTLTPQDEPEEEPQNTGVTALLRQTWAHLSGAA